MLKFIGSRDFFWLGAIALTVLALSISLPEPWPQLLSFLLLAIWPLFTWKRWQSGSLEEQWVMSGALVLLLNALAVLLILYLPGPLPRWLQLTGHAAIAVFPLARKQDPPKSGDDSGKDQLLAILLTLFILLAFRLPGLGYSEFQGDEGTIMIRAAGIIAGDDAELFLHQKGPVEILLPLSMWNLAGTINEFWARSLFAWASALALLALICLANRWFRQPFGLVAGLLFALSGFAIAFGRIVQYQSLVMLWGVMVMLHMIRYQHSRLRKDLVLAAAFLAGGLLAHYDAILILPAAAALFLSPFPRFDRPFWRNSGYAVVTGAIILAVFYVPFFLNPSFGRTGSYLIQARLGAGEGRRLLSWSGPAVWRMLTFYNSTYTVIGMALLILVALTSWLRRRDHLAALLYFAVPLIFYLFIVADPRTHVYTFFPGGAVLAAAGLDSMTRWLQARPLRHFYYAGMAAFTLFLLVSASYVYLMFIDHTPERQRTWMQNRPLFGPVTWEEPPRYGLFGFPHQAGWRLVADLLTASAYPYASNEEEEITNWYMAHAPRTHCSDFQTFILTENTQDELPYDPALLDTLGLQYRVTVNGRPSMQIFGRRPVTEVHTLEATGSNRWLTPAQAVPPVTTGDHPVNLVLGDDQVRLLGYDLSDSSISPGEELVVTLYWQALAPFDRNFQTFVHLTDGDILAQHDGAPECDINPTTRWEPGQIIPDPHVIHIPADASAGQVILLTGMYDLLTLDRLPIAGTGLDIVHLNALFIREDKE